MKTKKRENYSKITISHNKNLLFFIAILFIILLSSIVLIKYLGKQTGQTEECITDKDCVKQRTTCCSCQMGGEEVCMPSQNTTYWKEKLNTGCKENIMCTAMYNCKETSCICKNKKCIEE